MSQKKINQYFSSSNLPPKGRGREEEPRAKEKIDVNRNKRIKSAVPNSATRVGINKRKPDTEQTANEKKLRREDAREKMEMEVNKENENFNQGMSDRENDGEHAERISIESINVNSLIEMSRLTRVKTMVKYWEKDVTVMVDTRIGKFKAGLINREGNKIFLTDKPFRGVAIKVNKRLEPEEV